MRRGLQFGFAPVVLTLEAVVPTAKAGAEFATSWRGLHCFRAGARAVAKHCLFVAAVAGTWRRGVSCHDLLARSVLAGQLVQRYRHSSLPEGRHRRLATDVYN